MVKLVRALTVIIHVCTILALVGRGLQGTFLGQAVAIATSGQCSFDQVRDGEHFQEQMGKMRAAIGKTATRYARMENTSCGALRN